MRAVGAVGRRDIAGQLVDKRRFRGGQWMQIRAIRVDDPNVSLGGAFELKSDLISVRLPVRQS